MGNEEKSLAGIDEDGGILYYHSDTEDEKRFMDYIRGTTDIRITPGDVQFTPEYGRRGFSAHLWPDKPLEQILVSNGRDAKRIRDGVSLGNVLLIHMLPKNSEEQACITASFRRKHE